MKKYPISKLLVIFAMATTPFLTTCTDRTSVSVDENDDTQANSDLSALLPLKVGNQWRYNYEDNSNGISGSLTWEIIEKRDLDGQTGYLLKQTLSVTGLNRTLIISRKSGGIYVNGVINSTGNETIYTSPRPFLKYPIEVGASFINWEGLEFVLIAVGKSVGTDVGTYSSLKYHLYKNNVEVGTWFWIRSIGAARLIKNNPDSNSTLSGGISILSSFQIN